MRNPRGEVAFYVNREYTGARIRARSAATPRARRNRNETVAAARASGLFVLLFLPAADFRAACTGVVEVIEAGDVEGFVVVAKDVRVLGQLLVAGHQHIGIHSGLELLAQEDVHDALRSVYRLRKLLVRADAANLALRSVVAAQPFHQVGHLPSPRRLVLTRYRHCTGTRTRPNGS